MPRYLVIQNFQSDATISLVSLKVLSRICWSIWRYTLRTRRTYVQTGGRTYTQIDTIFSHVQ